MAKIPDYVRVVELPSGRRYEVRVETAGASGRRQQSRKRFRTLKEATDFYATVRGERAAGTFTAPSGLTLRQAVDAYLDSLTVRPNTMSAYAVALRPAITALGDKSVQSLTREDFERLVKRLMKGGAPLSDWRRPMKLPAATHAVTTPWKATSIRPMLARLDAVFKRLVDDGTVPRNVVSMVRAPTAERYDHRTLTTEQVTVLYAHVRDDRLEHLHHLALHGLRRGEIAGLKWSNVDLDSDTPLITIAEQRLDSPDGAVEGDTKTQNSVRELPIPSTLLPILKRARKRSREEQLAEGSAWDGAGHVVANEFGQPYYPTTIGSRWAAALEGAGLPHVRLHDARHTCGTLMHLAGVPIAVIAAWLGHADASFTQRVYAHSQNAALITAAETFAAAMTPAEEKKAK